MSPQLDAIWQQIQTLPDADRLVLEERLQELADQQWRQESAAAGAASPTQETGWRAVYGAAKPDEVAELQRILDQEFSGIDPEGWD